MQRCRLIPPTQALTDPRGTRERTNALDSNVDPHASGERVNTNAADSPSRKTLWLVSHERDNPMVLVQKEYLSDEAINALRCAIADRVGNDVHVDPPVATDQISRRYDVHDHNGWLATFWLSEEQIASDEGMLTAIVSPAARQRGHHTFHRS